MDFHAAIPTVAFGAARRAAGRQPAADIKLSEYGGVTLPIDYDRWATFARGMGFEELRVLGNGQSNATSVMPPHGYVASVQPDRAFCGQAWIGTQKAFRGLAYCRVTTAQSRLSDADIAAIKRRLNVLVRDKSPRPPLLRQGEIRASVESGWAPSLGADGRLALCESPAPGQLGFHYYLVVVAGLDEATYDDLDAEMHQLVSAKSHTYATVFGAGGVLEIYRQLAAENRRRLLALGMQAFGLSGAQVRTHPTPYEYEHPAAPDQWSLPIADKWLRLTTVPAWLRVPRRPPRDVPEALPEQIAGFAFGAALPPGDPRLARFPSYVADAVDCPFNDVLPIQAGGAELMAVYMGAAPTTSATGVPATSGPCGFMTVFNADHTVAWENSAYNAFPVEGRQIYDEAQAAPDIVTWEEAALLCRGVYSRYEMPPVVVDVRAAPLAGGTAVTGTRAAELDELYGAGCKAPALQFRPLLVRAAMVDANGLDCEPLPGAERMRAFNVSEREPM